MPAADRLVTGDYRGDFSVLCFFAYLFPGPFYGRGWSVQRVATYLYLDRNGIFGQSLEVAAGIVLVFILFGNALYAVGGATFLTDLSLALMGRFRGGPAKMAIMSSSLFGTISGSAVANVVVDGTMTIPMMKKSGYPTHVAAAVEATASTGGQIMPPVMGAAAFLSPSICRCPTLKSRCVLWCRRSCSMSRCLFRSICSPASITFAVFRARNCLKWRR